jgi:hypothetical protein
MTFSSLKPSTKPMKRTAFARKPTTALTGALSAESRQMAKRVKPVKCKACRQEFIKARPGQKVCGPDCAAALVMSERAKKERKELKARKEAVKRRSEWVSEAQAAFNAYVRARDVDKPCICCGKPFEPQKPGGSVDAGHYLSRGSAPHLRFDERNCFAQRKNCNRPGGTTREAFRNGVVDRIGLPAVEALEAEQGLAKWTIQDLKEIKTTYRAKLKQLQGLMGVGK